MKVTLLVIQTISALILTLLILVQSKGTGLSKSLGGGGLKSFTRRGLEKLIFRSTFVVLTIFLVISLIQLVI